MQYLELDYLKVLTVNVSDMIFKWSGFLTHPNTTDLLELSGSFSVGHQSSCMQ